MTVTHMKNWDRNVRPTFAAVEPTDRPSIMIAGEFSAGKTKLINGLLGEKVLPSNVTATALPPIWLTSGTSEALLRVDADGSQEEIESLDEVDLEQTQYCVLTHPSPFLASCNIIDTPGSSDPNMRAEAWQRMLGFADAVIWCTNATQAWRQSEKAVWKQMPERLIPSVALIVTHADLVADDKQRGRVAKRLTRETNEFFEAVVMASLLEDDDIDRIRGVLEDHAAKIGATGSGEKNEIVASFVASKNATAAPELGADETTKKRSSVLRHFAPSKPQSKSRSQE